MNTFDDILYFKKIERIDNSSIFYFIENTKKKNQKLFQTNLIFFEKIQNPYLKFFQKKTNEYRKSESMEKKHFLFFIFSQILTIEQIKSEKHSLLCIQVWSTYLKFFSAFFLKNFQSKKLHTLFFQKLKKNAVLLSKNLFTFQRNFETFFQPEIFQKNFKKFLGHFLFEIHLFSMFQLNQFFEFQKLNLLTKNFSFFLKKKKSFIDFWSKNFFIESKTFKLLFFWRQFHSKIQKRKVAHERTTFSKVNESCIFRSSPFQNKESKSAKHCRIQTYQEIFEILMSIFQNYFASAISLREKSDSLVTWKNSDRLFFHAGKSAFSIYQSEFERIHFSKFFQIFYNKFHKAVDFLKKSTRKRKEFSEIFAFSGQNFEKKNWRKTVFLNTFFILKQSFLLNFKTGRSSILFPFFENFLEKTLIDISHQVQPLRFQKEIIQKFNDQKIVISSMVFFSQRFRRCFFHYPIFLFSKHFFSSFLTFQKNFLAVFQTRSCQLNFFFSRLFSKKLWQKSPQLLFQTKTVLLKEKVLFLSNFFQKPKSERRFHFLNQCWFLSQKFQSESTKIPFPWTQLFFLSPFFATFFGAYSQTFQQISAKKFQALFFHDEKFAFSEKFCSTVTFEGFCFLHEIYCQKKLKQMNLFKQQPTAAMINLHLKKCKKIVQKAIGKDQLELMKKLQREIKSWSNRSKTTSTKLIFQYCDSVIFKFLWNWARKTHPNKSKMWIRKKYFYFINSKQWFFGKKKGRVFLCLPLHQQC